MRIAFVGGFAFSPKGTIQARAYPLAAELVNLGHEVTIFLTPYDNLADSGRQWTESGVRIRNLSLGSTPMSYPRLLVDLWRELKEYRPYLIHIFKPKGFSGAVGSYHLVKGRQAVVVDCDDWEGWGGWNEVKSYPWVIKEFIDRQERWMMRRAPALTVASRSLNRRVLEARGSESGVYYVPNGVFAETTSSIYATTSSRSPAEIRREVHLPEGPLILYSGHFEPAEDPMFLCRVSARVAEENRAGLVLVGDGPEQQRVRDFFAQRPAARVHYFPRLPHAQFLQLVHACDIAAFPYPDNQVHRSKCSARIVDYMRMGKAVITSAVGQNLEYLENSKSGLLVPPDDEDAFSAGLELLLRYPELRARLGNNARTRIQKAFSWSGQPLEQCLAAYEHLTSRTP